MTVHDLVKRFSLKLAAGQKGIERRVAAGYCGDLLSDIMTHAAESCVWLTVQTHPNIVAVAVLRNIAAIVIAGGHTPDTATVQKANEEGIPLLLWPDSAYRLAGKLFALGIGGGCE